MLFAGASEFEQHLVDVLCIFFVVLHEVIAVFLGLQFLGISLVVLPSRVESVG